MLRYAVQSLERSLSQNRNSFSLFILLILFSASGMCALIYEVVWYQLLQLAIGSTSVSLGMLLATFMGGLCIGSVWFPRIRLAAASFERSTPALNWGSRRARSWCNSACPL